MFRRWRIALLVWSVVLPFLAVYGADVPSMVLHHGTVVSMTSPQDIYEAIAILGTEVLAVGSNQQILAMAGPQTERIDLQGTVVFPGFIDPHAHLLSGSAMAGLSFEQALELAVSHGITAAAEMYTTPDVLAEAVALAERGALRVRMSLYLLYNDLCGHLLGPWYVDAIPGIGSEALLTDELAPRLRLGGVKIFAERSSCGEEILGISFSSDLQAVLSPAGSVWYGANNPHFSALELSKVIQEVAELGLPVAIHAMGDAGVDVALEAVEMAFGGVAPASLRPLILHNLFVRDDQLPHYGSLGVVAAVEAVNPCYVDFYDDLVPPEFAATVRRWNDLVEAGGHVTANSDWPWCDPEEISPLFRLRGLVSPENVSVTVEDWEPCPPLRPGQTVSRWDALRMLTIEAAYALHREDHLGTLEPGKLADLVVLSANPLTAELDGLAEIEVLRTMIGGVSTWVKK